MMRPVLQRRPRRGTDFVLPDVPMLDSPDWSDEETDRRSNRAPPRAHAANSPQVVIRGMIAPSCNPCYSPSPVQRIVLPLPQPRNGVRYPSPGLPRAVPSLEQQQQLTSSSPHSLAGNRGQKERPFGGDFNSNGYGRLSSPQGTAEAKARNRVALERADGARRMDAGKQRRTEREAEEAEDDDEDDDDRDEYEFPGGDSHDPALASRAQFAGGSLFVSHQHDDDDDDDDDASLNSSTVARHFSNDSSTDDSDSGCERDSHPRRRRDETESVVAPSYACYTSQPGNSNGTKDERTYQQQQQQQQRKPSLFAMTTATSYSPSNNVSRSPLASSQYSNKNNDSANRPTEVSVAASTFNRLLTDVDETPNNHFDLGVSTVFVGSQSVRLDCSAGPAGYTYEGGHTCHSHQQQQQQQQRETCDVSATPGSVGVNGAHAALVDRHGTFLMSTEAGNLPTQTMASKESPLGHGDLCPTPSVTVTNSSPHLLAVSSAHSPFEHATANAVGSAPLRRSPGSLASPSRSHSLDGNQSISPTHEYDLMRENESVVSMPAVPKPMPRPSSHSNFSGDKSEEERYEQMRQSRFFQSLNSRLMLRKTAEMEASRASNFYNSVTWQEGVYSTATAGDDEVGAFSPGSRDSASPVRSAHGTSAGYPIPSSASPNADKLNFRNRIVSRDQRPQLQQNQKLVQPLSRPLSTHGASMPSPAGAKASSSNENSAQPSPSPTALAPRYSLNSQVDGVASSVDATVLKTSAAAHRNDSLSKDVVVSKSTSALSTTTTTAGLGGPEGDEYELLCWANSSDGPRRTSAVSGEDPREFASSAGAVAAAMAKTHPSPPPGGSRSSVMPISLQLAQTATSRRPTSAITVVLPSERGGAGFSYIDCDSSSPKQQEPQPHTVSEDQRVTDNRGGVQWSPNDCIFYYPAADSSPTAGQRASPQSIKIPAGGPQRSPSFGYDEYFLLNSFHSSAASPHLERLGSDEGVAMTVQAVMANSLRSSSGVVQANNAGRGANSPASAPTSGSQQRRLSVPSDKAHRVPSAPPPPPLSQEAVATVDRSLRLPSMISSGISEEAVQELEDYGFPVHLGATAAHHQRPRHEPSDAYYDMDFDMDYDADGYSYLPPVRETGEASTVPRNENSLSRSPGPQAANGAGTSAPPRQRLSSSLVDEFANYYYNNPLQMQVQMQMQVQPQPPRHDNPHKNLRSAPASKEAQLTKKKAEQGEGNLPAVKPPLPRALSISSAAAQKTRKHSPHEHKKGPSRVKSTPPQVTPPSRHVESLPAFEPLHATEYAAHVDLPVSSK
ncbi:hypothetical protein NQL31_006509 [Lotmaria passim]